MKDRTNEFEFQALVVDDEPIICRSVMRSLQKVGFRCRSVFDGDQATRLLADNEFDAVITDVKMPYKNGQSLLLDLMGRPDRPLVVVLTAVDDPHIIEQLILMGVDDVVFKPLKHDTFAARVKALLIRKRAGHAPRELRVARDLLG